MKKKLYIALITAISFISLENVYSMLEDTAEENKNSSREFSNIVNDEITIPHDSELFLRVEVKSDINTHDDKQYAGEILLETILSSGAQSEKSNEVVDSRS